MEGVTNNSNDYVDKRRVLEPNIKIWDQKHVSAPFDIKLLYHLFALILYMGVVCLLCKTEYRKYDDISPYKPITNEMGIRQDWFAFLWRIFIFQA